MSLALPFLLEFLEGFILLHLHWGVLAGLSVLAHRKLKLSDELFRKLLHLAAVFAIIPIVLPISSWMVSLALCLVFAAEAYLGIKLSVLMSSTGPLVLGISAQGVVVNGLFWRKYTKLSAQQDDAILGSQRKLYRAKTFVDLCVFVAVTCVFIAPGAPWTP